MSGSLPDGSALAEQIASARWYGGKGATIVDVSEEDRLELAEGVALHVLRVEAEARPAERYLYLTGEERLAAPVLESIVEASDRGDWSFEPGVVLPGLMPSQLTQRPIGLDQSNTTLVVGERLALKLYRRLEPGPHPDIEIGRYLTEQASVAFVPAYAGCVRWRGHAVAMLQAYVSDAADGWTWAAQAVQDGDVSDISRLGANTATLHAALAQMEARTATAEQLAGWRRSADAQLRRALELVDGEAGSELRDYAPRLREEFAALELGAPPTLTRVHGDYHVGQILRSVDGLRVVDFEGEPTKGLDERSALGTPLRDVAAMLRSFDHLARHVDRDILTGEGPRVEHWIMDAREAFLGSYGDHDPRLLRALEAEKETYEFIYAATFLPEWMYAPVAGMRWLMGTRAQ
ncbi:MAG: maltokinase [Gaiellales bacterium]|nr:maltokinase [Gaiellales bacterium]